MASMIASIPPSDAIMTLLAIKARYEQSIEKGEIMATCAHCKIANRPKTYQQEEGTKTQKKKKTIQRRQQQRHTEKKEE